MSQAIKVYSNETIFHRKRKNFFDCKKRNKIKQRDVIRVQSDKLSGFCQTMGLKINEIILTPDKEGENHVKRRITVLPYELSKSKIVFQHLMTKDLVNMSSRGYQLQRKSLIEIQRIPGITKVLKMQHALDSFFQIMQNDFGFFCSPEQKIKYVCEKFLVNNPNFLTNRFKIKLNTDSTSISGSHITLLNFSFNLIDDVKMCMNINGTYLLGSFEVTKEDYDQVKASLKELLNLLENISTIKINGKIYKIDFYMCCDYKMMRILYGQKASNALEGCFWCPALMDVVPKISEIGTKKHTISRRLSDIFTNKEPIIKFIEYNMCVLDDLHLFLRVTDKLFDLLLLKCLRLDQNDGDILHLRKNLNVFSEFLEKKCSIKNAFFVTSKRPEYGKIQFRSLNGTERMRIFTELYEPKLNRPQSILFMDNLSFPKTEQVEDFTLEDAVWLGFYDLYKRFKNFPLKTTLDERQKITQQIKTSLKEWLSNYLYLNNKNDFSEKLTPYIHCFVFHYCEMLEIHGNIHIFTNQPNEKLNDFCTQYYHKDTNKNNTEKIYIKQLMKKRNRIEFYNLKGDLNEFFDRDLLDQTSDSSNSDEDIEEDVIF